MAVPRECTVLVIGGGPGGSYTAAALAREGIDTVLLEAAIFPRYHIGESMLASIRHLLRFIDLDSTFDNYGFTKKADTDFLAAGGPENYAWNVVRSEADNLLFQHAGKSGAKVFDGVKVTAVEFNQAANLNGYVNPPAIETKADNLRSIVASYHRGTDGDSGAIRSTYLVDASGRAGVLSTKYLKNRIYNRGLKNIACWGYWRGTGTYAEGTARANSPYFEALRNGSGWAWLIPLHNGTTSVGVVMNQDFATALKNQGSSTSQVYLKSLELAPNLLKLISNGELVTDIKSASDFSYSATSYASPYVRIVGDAGCFIDPFFSSGVHLAMIGALSAATTICAAIRKDCEESVAAKWHSTKVADSYTRFLMVVLSGYKQINNQNEPVLSDLGQDNLDQAFARFRPIIQGQADVSNGVSQSELSETIAFCANAWEGVKPDERAAILQKIQHAVDNAASKDSSSEDRDPEAILEEVHQALSEEEKKVMKYIRARQLLRTEDTMHIDNFGTDVIDGLAPHVQWGCLTLRKAVPVAVGGIETRQSIG